MDLDVITEIMAEELILNVSTAKPTEAVSPLDFNLNSGAASGPKGLVGKVGS